MERKHALCMCTNVCACPCLACLCMRAWVRTRWSVRLYECLKRYERVCDCICACECLKGIPSIFPHKLDL